MAIKHTARTSPDGEWREHLWWDDETGSSTSPRYVLVYDLRRADPSFRAHKAGHLRFLRSKMGVILKNTV